MPRDHARSAAALVIAALIAVACTGGGPQSSGRPTSAGLATAPGPTPPSSVAVSTVPTGTATPGASPDAIAKVLGSTPVPGNPGGLLAAFGSIWVAVRHGGNVSRVDPSSGRVTAQVKAGVEPAYLTSDGKAVWAIAFSSRTLTRIDPATNATTTVAIPGDAGGWPVAGADGIFQWTSAGLIKVDAATRMIVATTSGLQAESLAFANGLVWVGTGTAGISRLDPSTLAVKDTIAPEVDASGVLAFDGTWMWAANRTTATQLDPTSGKVVQTYQLPYKVDGGMGAASAGRFWFQLSYPDAFGFIDGGSKVLHPVQDLPSRVTEGLFVLGIDAHHAWISDWDANTLYRVDPGT